MDYRVNLGIFVVPVSAGKSRVMFQSLVGAKIPTWLSHAGTNRFLNTDVWLHEAEIEARRRSEEVEDYVYASKSDFAPNTFRKWWNEFGFSKAVSGIKFLSIDFLFFYCLSVLTISQTFNTWSKATKYFWSFLSIPTSKRTNVAT